jgi:hypothetical protein
MAKRCCIKGATFWPNQSLLTICKAMNWSASRIGMQSEVDGLHDLPVNRVTM